MRGALAGIHAHPDVVDSRRKQRTSRRSCFACRSEPISARVSEGSCFEWNDSEPLRSVALGVSLRPLRLEGPG